MELDGYFIFPFVSEANRKMKLSNGRNKKPKLTIANAFAKGRKPTAKNRSSGTMPTSESAKKDTEKSTAVINQAYQPLSGEGQATKG